jgi:hypothetical protein
VNTGMISSRRPVVLRTADTEMPPLTAGQVRDTLERVRR